MLEDLNDPSFTGELIEGQIRDGVPLRQALADVIRGIGIQEFAKKAGMASSNLIRALDPKQNPTEETLERLLKPFELRLGIVRHKRRRKS